MPFGDRPALVSLPLFLLRFPLAMCQLIFMIRWHRIQIINLHYPADNFVYFALCRRLLSFFLVTSIHGADIFPNGDIKRPSSRWLSSVLLGSDAIVAPSKRFRQDFLVAYPELQETTTFIHNGVSLTETKDELGGATKAYPGRYILCISAYKQQKAIDVLLRAFQQVYRSEPSVKLVLVGSGPLFETLEELATDLGIRQQVEFLGRQNHAEAMKLLRDCELFVLPSRFETFGIVILEAWAFEKPVVATLAGGIPEIVESGENGLLVPADDAQALAEALMTLLRDHDQRRAVARNGHETLMQRFLSDHNGAKYEALFGDLIGKTSREAA